MTSNDGVSFRENFWGDPPERGLDALDKANSAALEVTSQFLAYLDERADAEEQFARRLRRLHDSAAASTAVGILQQFAPHPSSSGNADDGNAGGAQGNSGANGLAYAASAEVFKGLRDAFTAALEEARQQATVHKAAAVAFAASASDVKEALKEQKTARKAALNDATAVMRERGALEAAMKKARAKYVESVAKKDGAVNTVATLEQQGRPATEVTKMRVKMQELAKKEMILDQELKEAIEKLQAHHSEWVSRMGTFMDTMQRKEEQRVDFLRRQLASISTAVLSGIPALSEASTTASQAAASLNTQAELSDWVKSASTGNSPPPPPQYIPRAARVRMTDVTVDASSGSSPPPPGALVPERRVKAVHQFIGEESDELDFLPGETFVVLSSPEGGNGWWVGKNYNRIGWFPAAYVQLVEQ